MVMNEIVNRMRPGKRYLLSTYAASVGIKTSSAVARTVYHRLLKIIIGKLTVPVLSDANASA